MSEEECFDRLDKYVFSRDMAVKEDWYDLLNYHQAQLQAYKDKEDNYQNREIKIRNMINSHNYLTNNNEALKSMSNCILQILNDKVVE